MTSELLSHGERRSGQPDRTGWWYAAAAVGLAVAILLGLLREPERDGPGPAAARTPRPSPSPVTAQLDSPTESRLLVAGDRLLRLDVDRTAARPVPVPGLLAGGQVASLTPRRGATVVLVSPRDRADGAAGSAWAVPDGGGTPVALGRAGRVLAAVAPDRVWLVTPAGAPDGDRLLLRQLDVRGRVRTTPYAVRAGGRLVADVEGGFLLERRVAGVSALDIVDRRTMTVRAPVARRASALAVAPQLVAWSDPDCHLRCLVTVKNLRSGDRVVVSILDVAGYGGAVSSPDATRLAFTARVVVTSGGPPEPVLLVAGIGDPGISVVRLSATDGAFQPAGATLPQALTWSANGQWVFLATQGPAQRLLAWRLDGAAVAAVPFPVAGVRLVAPA